MLNLENQNLKNKLQELVKNNQENLNNIKGVALDQAWKVLQLATAETIQAIEINTPSLAGKDKKELALTFLSTFYDSVFVIVNVPFIPSFLQPIIHKSIKSLLMILIGATIDAMVTTFRNAGIFKQKMENNNG